MRALVVNIGTIQGKRLSHVTESKSYNTDALIADTVYFWLFSLRPNLYEQIRGDHQGNLNTFVEVDMIHNRKGGGLASFTKPGCL
ncbi:hypothetical protein EWB00_007167 [Schistosoma japonicum]|uniref:Uncharacterized protein n=1 Tax=Schistosoma japonicum TaxID=6182 RepID=A0A4Z2CVL1_SCHJA|nr:hypothetical protein EWB00_007167 [Schistosoma japonicum]